MCGRRLSRLNTIRMVVVCMSKYVIVVESGADVTPELRERYGIVSVPIHEQKQQSLR